MNIALWIIAGVLALIFLVAGSNKLFIPYAKLSKAPGAGWVNDFSPTFVKLLGVIEIIGAVGLLLPGLLGRVPVLAPIAAVGLALIMVGAATVSLRRHEPKHALLNVVYLALAVFLAVGRFGLWPFGS
jgi:uncharacterized membrane protein YphA (DoxX/SURF4 family)